MLMARGRARLEWAQTAELWVLLINPIRDIDTHPEPFKTSDINPFAEIDHEQAMREKVKRAPSVIKAGSGKLKRMNFSDGRVGN
jgi:hypothetical protein